MCVHVCACACVCACVHVCMYERYDALPILKNNK